MGFNKFVYYGVEKFNISGDSVSESTLLSGATAHDRNGDQITGTCTYDADTSDGTVAVAEMLDGKVAYSHASRLVGTMPNIGKQTGSISTKAGTVGISTGYHDGSGSVGISSTEQAKIIPGNIKDGVTILGVTGTLSEGSQEVPQSKEVTPSTSDQTVLPDAGYTCLSQVVVKKVPYSETPTAGGGTTITIG